MTADWSSSTLAYGSDRNIAIWNPQAENGKGVSRLLVGHTDTVNAVKFLDSSYLLSGSVDKTIKLWKRIEGEATDQFECVQTLDQHTGSINCITIAEGHPGIFVSGAADGTFIVWGVSNGSATMMQKVVIKPRFFPLALALASLNGGSSYVLAVAGTTSIIQVYVADDTAEKPEFELKATLSGHEGWIRSLAFARENGQIKDDLILSSASQDKYIRLWRIHQGKELPAAAAANDPAAGAFMPGKALSNKAHRFVAGGEDYSATFEALLLGHEDWVYSTVWRHLQKDGENSLQLLSASADNSLSIWEQDKASGIWVSMTRLGEISAQKGSTTATGSTGGFWTGLWSDDGKSIVCIGRTGSWRQWNYAAEEDSWMPHFGVGGHVRTVTGVSWSKHGDYLLSTSLDQTTRLHAEWKRGSEATWHEMARPQIHGYDLNCIDSLGDKQFVSGADEKLLRVFDEPKAVAQVLQDLAGIKAAGIQEMPDAANVPVLGLSNKAVETEEADNTSNEPSEGENGLAKANNPPLEDHLSRSTLWPEIEKLYGHGYEISALATSHDGSVIATACRASSLDHAVIRLFDSKTWNQVMPPLTAHSLTVTRLRFSPDDNLLLSVGRDRQWAIFERVSTGSTEYKLKLSDPKGHSRMILDAAWAPGASGAFATAGRDKSVKLWSKSESGYSSVLTLKEDTPVTSIDFADVEVEDNQAWLAVGTEAGRLSFHLISLLDHTVKQTITLAAAQCPSQAITQLAWRPAAQGQAQIAVASEDSSLRVLSLASLQQNA